MPLYDYLRDDGEWVTKLYSITNIPDEIIDDDGVKAKREWKPGTTFNITWGKGGMPSASLKAQNERRRKDNINAGKRGEKSWRERTPKIVHG